MQGREGLWWKLILTWGFLGRRSQALCYVLGSNPVVGVDLGPDVADHAEKLGQDTFAVSLLGALHALYLAPCSLLHLSRQVPLRAHGLGSGRKGGKEKRKSRNRERSIQACGRVLEQGQEARPSPESCPPTEVSR